MTPHIVLYYIRFSLFVKDVLREVTALDYFFLFYYFTGRR